MIIIVGKSGIVKLPNRILTKSLEVIKSLYFIGLAGLVTGVGALITVVLKKPSEKLLSFSLGFAAGIMIGISTLTLIPESLGIGNIFTCLTGFACGAFFLWLIDVLLPHIHKIETECNMYMKMGTFIALGIAWNT